MTERTWFPRRRSRSRRVEPCRMRIRSSLLVVTLLVAAFAGTPSDAAHGDACGGSWSASGAVNSCGFAFTGMPITIFGDSIVESGAAEVRVWVTISTTSPVVLECTARAPGFASCGDDLSLVEAFGTFAGSIPMECNVAGRGGGLYGCASGCQSPAQGPICEFLLTPPG